MSIMFDATTLRDDRFINIAGFQLLVAGHAQVSIQGISHYCSVGTLIMRSPLVLIDSETNSPDAQWIRFETDADQVVSVTRHVISDIIQKRIFLNPCFLIAQQDIHNIQYIYEKVCKREKELTDLSQSHIRPLEEQSILLWKQALIAEVLICVSRHKPIMTAPQTRRMDIYTAFMQLLYLNYQTHRDVAWYADALHISPKYFSKVVRTFSGESPVTWITRVTIAHAKHLLQQREWSIKQVAENLGFPEQFTFRKYFKHYVGLSPTAYRIELDAQVTQ
ncbi:MAG: helix-turn-helix transcriptional regulator [Candidatus Limimorpha sp.]